MIPTFRKDADAASTREALVDMVVHLLLIDVRHLLEIEALLPVCQFALLFPETRGSAKLLFDAELCIGEDLDNLRDRRADRLWERDCHPRFELRKKAGSVADDETRIVV